MGLFKQLESSATGSSVPLEQALDALETHRFDVALFDLRMPVMDGYEATRQIRQCPGGDAVPIIAITASAFNE